jgi:hypothetical protein
MTLYKKENHDNKFYKNIFFFITLSIITTTTILQILLNILILLQNLCGVNSLCLKG